MNAEMSSGKRRATPTGIVSYVKLRIKAPLARGELLSDAERRLIEKRCRGLYEAVFEVAGTFVA